MHIDRQVLRSFCFRRNPFRGLMSESTSSTKGSTSTETYLNQPEPLVVHDRSRQNSFSFRTISLPRDLVSPEEGCTKPTTRPISDLNISYAFIIMKAIPALLLVRFGANNFSRALPVSSEVETKNDLDINHLHKNDVKGTDDRDDSRARRHLQWCASEGEKARECGAGRRNRPTCCDGFECGAHRRCFASPTPATPNPTPAPVSDPAPDPTIPAPVPNLTLCEARACYLLPFGSLLSSPNTLYTTCDDSTGEAVCGCVDESDTYPDCCGPVQECATEECTCSGCFFAGNLKSCDNKLYCYDVGCNDGYRGLYCEPSAGPKCICPTSTQQSFINSGLAGCNFN